MPSLPDPQPGLLGERVALRLAAERDIPEVLIAHQDDPHLYEQVGLERPPSGAQLGRQMEEADEDRRSGRRLTLTILEPGSDELVGQLEVHDIDWEGRRAALYAWVALRARGRGLEVAARDLVARWLAEECGLDA